MTDSQELLVEYAKNGSESAFRELVSRYSNLVYSTALRLVSGDTHLAEDVSQTVFMGLASKGRALSTEVMLGRWLHQHTYHVAMMTLRADRRRQSREREAVAMNTLQDDNGADWREVAPILDEAITQLGSEDRTAILLRFFEQRDFRSVGEALGSDEDAARMRVNRALEKLHSLLKHRGVTLSVAALGTALATQAVTAAPAGFAASVAGTALAAALAGTTTAATIATYTTMNWINAKSIAAIVGSALIAATTTYVVQHHVNESARTENAALREQTNRPAEMKGPQLANERLPAQEQVEAALPESERLELMRLRGQVGELRKELAALKGSAGGPASATAQVATETEAKELASASETTYALRMLGWANRVYAHDHADVMPTSFDQLKPIFRLELAPGLNLDRFEFVDYGRAVSEAEPNVALIRERTARQLPDGRWARFYLYVDGAAHQRISDDGNFDRFEKP